MRLSAAVLGVALGALCVACGGTQSSPNATIVPNTQMPEPTNHLEPQATQSPPPGVRKFPSSWKLIEPIQVFDDFPTTGTAMTDAQISSDATRYAAVWGSFNPSPWRTADPSLAVSRYYIPEEDSNLISGHNLAWWKANHPDWILYACDANNNPTTEIAYVPGVGFPDVPLDIHNSAVINYQIKQSLVPYLVANGYNAVAFDQINFNNILIGGNPELGQTIVQGDYACGIYENGVFVRRYSSKSDPAYAADMLNWLQTARKIFTYDPTISPYHLKILVNHTVQRTNDPNEQALLKIADMELDETGFSDYGYYQRQGASGLFGATVNWMRWLQAHDVGIGIIDKFDQETSVTADHLEYSIATYLMGKEQAAYLYVGPANGSGYGYGAEQWHQEYTANLGAPCAEMYGGSGYDPNNPQIWYRRFVGGMAVVNSGSLPIASEDATLPPNHAYTDLEGRPVTRPLSVSSNDGYVLLTSPRDGCK